MKINSRNEGKPTVHSYCPELEPAVTDSSAGKVLLAVDGSAAADNAAAYLGRNADALGIREVDILNVQNVPSYHTYAEPGTPIPLDVIEFSTQVAAKATRLLDTANVRHRFITQLGGPADQIVQVAEANRDAEIVMGSRGMGHLAGVVLGSVAYQVIHRSSLPVTLVCDPGDEAKGPAATREVHRVLLAVDGSTSARKAIDYVCNLARRGARLEVEVLNVPSLVPAVCFEDQTMADRYYRTQGAAVVDEVSGALQDTGLCPNVHIEPGDAAQTIVRVARGRNCTRIVMGSRGLGWIGNLVVGSVAYKVLQLAPIPVSLMR
jgi:nucleotide-binding universal stress UspA family protein